MYVPMKLRSLKEREVLRINETKLGHIDYDDTGYMIGDSILIKAQNTLKLFYIS